MAESYKAKVKEIMPLSSTAKAIRFEFNKKLDFIPGQFIMIDFILKERNGFKIQDNKKNLQRRAFSISSSPSSELIEITAKKTSNPFVSEYVVDCLEIEDEFDVMAPYGVFNLDIKKSKKNILFLAAGSGIAPFISMLRYLEEIKSEINTTLIYSNKTSPEILWKDEIESISKKNRNISHIFTLTNEEINNDANNKKGRISKELILEAINDKTEIDCYICGPVQFVQDLRQILIEIGIPKESIKIEVYE